jgi:hypothetical protein
MKNMTEKTVMTVNLEDEQISKLKSQSKTRGVSVSSIVRETISTHLSAVEADKAELESQRAATIKNFEDFYLRVLSNPENLVNREAFDRQSWIVEKAEDGTVSLLCADGKGRRKGDLIRYNLADNLERLKASVHAPFHCYPSWEDAAKALRFNDQSFSNLHHAHRRVESRDPNDKRTWYPIDTYVSAEVLLKDEFQSQVRKLFLEAWKRVAEIDGQLKRLGFGDEDDEEGD